MFEKTSIIGRLGKDPVLRYTKGAEPIPVANFSVAVNYKAAGEQKTKWFEVVAWRGLGTACANYLKKGSLVYIEGTVAAKLFDTANGPSVSLTLDATTVKFLDTQSQAQTQGYGQAQNQGYGQGQSQGYGQTQGQNYGENPYGGNIPF